MDQIRQRKFVLPQNTQCLPTFRRIGNYSNSISSASTIFLERDNTHTRLQSELKLNSKKASLDSEIVCNFGNKNDSDILSYSQSSSMLLFEDSLLHLQRLIILFSSKDHLFNHISQSLALTGFTVEASKSTAKIIANSFFQYTQIAQKVDFKAVKDQMNHNNTKIANLNKQIVQLKQQNLKSFQRIVKLQNQNAKYRKKIVSAKQKAKSPHSFMLNAFKEQYNKFMNKIVTFETLIFQKLIVFQSGLINVTNLRNSLLRPIHLEGDIRKTLKQNKKQTQIKSNNLGREAMKELSSNVQSCGQIEKLKKIVLDKTEEVLKLKSLLQNISQQLEEQKNLYEQMLDRNIELQKQIFLSTRPKVEEEESESFCIIDQDHYMEYINQEIVQMGQNAKQQSFE